MNPAERWLALCKSTFVCAESDSFGGGGTIRLREISTGMLLGSICLKKVDFGVFEIDLGLADIQCNEIEWRHPAWQDAAVLLEAAEQALWRDMEAARRAIKLIIETSPANAPA